MEKRTTHLFVDSVTEYRYADRGAGLTTQEDGDANCHR